MPDQPMHGGPYLIAAALCEKVLREQDGVYSLIRIVDRFAVTGSWPEMPPTVIRPVMVLMMKAGVFRGVAEVQIIPRLPSGAERPAVKFAVNFEGDDDRGVVLDLQLEFLVTETGLHWFEVRLLDSLLTRVPMRVVYLPQPSIAAGTQPASGPQS